MMGMMMMMPFKMTMMTVMMKIPIIEAMPQTVTIMKGLPTRMKVVPMTPLKMEMVTLMQQTMVERTAKLTERQ